MRGTWQTDVLGRRYFLSLPFVAAGRGLCLMGVATDNAQRLALNFCLACCMKELETEANVNHSPRTFPG